MATPNLVQGLFLALLESLLAGLRAHTKCWELNTGHLQSALLLVLSLQLLMEVALYLYRALQIR